MNGTTTALSASSRVAILTTVGFEEVELTEPLKALRDAGATVSVVSPKGPQVRAWKETDWGVEVPVDQELANADPSAFDALLLPGGVMNPDKLRMIPEAVAFVQHFFAEDKPVFAICHGSQTLIEAGVVGGRKLTSWPSLQTDLKNAGASWVDEETVVDGNLLTSRKPDDLPAFIEQAKQMLKDDAAATALAADQQND